MPHPASSCQSSERIPGYSPSSKVEVLWSDFVYVHILWPLLVQMTLSIIFGVIVAPLYRRRDAAGRFRNFMRLYVGSRDRPEAPRARLFAFICMLQMASSLVTVADWARNMYTQRTSIFETYLLAFTTPIDLLHWLVRRIRGEFALSDMWGMMGIVDALTIVPSIGRACLHFPAATEFITLRFLRAYCMLSGYHQIMSTGYFKHTGVLLQMVMLASLRIYCLIIPMAGLIMTLEILGDPAILGDHFIETPGGDRLSVIMTVNWVIVSIATLGDGSFYPRTVIGRSVWSTFLVVAVGYVFYIQFAFGQAWVRNREGSGTYKPRKHRRHLVVFLQAHGYAVQLSSVVLGLLSEALNTSTDEPWPDVVFFSETYWDEHTTGDATNATLNEFLKAKSFGSTARDHVFFIVGQSSIKEDLERACLSESALTYIVPDVNSNRPERDDELSIITALNLKRFYPDVRLRLMLLLPQSKDLAVQSGIMMERCFAVRELKAHMLAQNVRCHGLLPMITGIFKSVDAEQEAILLGTKTSDSTSDSTAMDDGSGSEDSSDSWSRPRRQVTSSLKLGSPCKKSVPEWVSEYVQGVSRGIHGFELAPEYTHLSFGELVVDIHRGCGAMVVAVLIEGNIQVCPQDPYWRPAPKHQVCFAVASSLSALDPWRDKLRTPVQWRQTLLESRDVLSRRAAEEGPHVAATKLMGKQLKDAILRAEEGVGSQDGDMERQVSDDSIKSGSSRCTMARVFAAGRRNSSFNFSCGSLATPGDAGRTGLTASEAAEEQSVAAVESVRRLRNQITGSQDLVVVVVCQGEVWQQVRAFVGALRAQYQPLSRPIVVLAPTEPPPRLMHGVSDGVLTLVGSSMKVQQLVEAGVLEASSVVVMAGEVPPEDSKRVSPFKDARVLLCARMLECWCGISKKEVFTTYELLDTNSVAALPHVMCKPAVQLDAFIQEKAFNDEVVLEEEEWEVLETKNEQHRPESLIQKAQHRAASLLEGGGGDQFDRRLSTDNLMRSTKAAVSSIAFDLRFAAGQVLTPEIWGCMLGRMYYNPAVIELTEVFIMPQRRGQHAFPWQIRPPKRYVNEEYEELVVDLALGYWSKSDRCDKAVGLREDMHSKEGPAVALALYRKRTQEHCFEREMAEGTGNDRYLVLAPPGNTILKEDDWVLVMGSRRFGKKAHQLGILRGYKKEAEKNPRLKRSSTMFNDGSTIFERSSSHNTGEFERVYSGGEVRTMTSGSKKFETGTVSFKEMPAGSSSLRASANENCAPFRARSRSLTPPALSRNRQSSNSPHRTSPRREVKIQEVPSPRTPSFAGRGHGHGIEGANLVDGAVCELGPMGFVCSPSKARSESEHSWPQSDGGGAENHRETPAWPLWRAVRQAFSHWGGPGRPSMSDDLNSVAPDAELAGCRIGTPEVQMEQGFIVLPK